MTDAPQSEVGVEPASALAKSQTTESIRDFASIKGGIIEREGVDEDAAVTALLRVALDSGTPLRCRVEGIVLSAKQPPRRPVWGRDD
jgi:hypothetical protein